MEIQQFLNLSALIILYFNDYLTNISLNYFENDNKYPIIISFFIKEKIKFKIEISDGDKIIMNRNIIYKKILLLNQNLPM